LQIGPANGVVVSGVLQSAVKHGLQLEVFTADQIESRWPGFKVPGELMGVLEPRAGYLLVEDCVRAHLQAAEALGAELRAPVEVVGWEPGETILLNTSAGAIRTRRLIVTAGPWAGTLLEQLGIAFRVLRKSLFWYERIGTALSPESGYPCYLFELPDGVFYGFPEIDQRGLKVAEHSGGQPVSDPQDVDREILPEDQQRIENFLAQHLPQVMGKLNEHSTCLYTMSPDDHFVVDQFPSEPNVVFAAGLSGHGFKFTPVLGKALAELALDGETALPVDFLSLARFV